MTFVSEQTQVPPPPGGTPAFAPIVRTPLRDIRPGRLIRGGRWSDAGRLPRYAGILLLSAACIWGPIVGYLKTAPLSFTSEMSLILPGSGASASVNINDIGQASSRADSAFSSPSISPTVTYKRLIGAERILVAAAERAGQDRDSFGDPRIELVDQTGLIKVAVTGSSPDHAQEKGDALLAAFFAELDALRNDELDVREDGGLGTLEDYRAFVSTTRAEISELQRETGLISAAQYDMLVAETERLAVRVEEISAELDQQSQSVMSLRATLGISPRLAAETLKLHADPEFASLIREMSAHSADLAALRGQYGGRHPVVQASNDAYSAAMTAGRARAQDLTTLDDALLGQLDLSPIGERAVLLSQLVQLDAQRNGKLAELASGQAQLAKNRRRVDDLLIPAARLEDLQRDFKVAEAVFASAMARSKSSRTDIYASYPLVQVLENPSRPSDPSSPKKLLAIAAGVMGTFMMIVGLALGWMRGLMIAAILGRKEPAPE